MKALILLILPIATLTISHNNDDSGKDNLLCYGGLPQADNETKTLRNTAFITGYSESLRNPLWTVYRLGNVKGKYNSKYFQSWERTREFRIDNRTDSKVEHDDYTSTGYDRGHMAPNSGILQQYGQMAQLETFLMSNICPQKPDLNREVWERLERKVRTEISQNDSILVTITNGRKKETEKRVQDVFVITGPIFGENSDTLKSGVYIPVSFYKILVYHYGYGATPKSVSFVFPQDAPKDAKIMDYVTSVDEIEELAGIDFFPELSQQKQHNLESVKRNFKLEEIQ